MATLCFTTRFYGAIVELAKTLAFQAGDSGFKPPQHHHSLETFFCLKWRFSLILLCAGCHVNPPSPMRAWCNGSHAALRTPCRNACRFKSCRSHQIPFTLSVEAMSFTFIPRFNYPELPNNSLRLCRICRSVGMVDKEVSKTFAETRVGSSPIFGTKGAHSNISFEEYFKFIG